ncbi:MAG: hypothetical protein HZA78_03270 [Candidatus Schekmanbacteria bacterium]|nr:hypothetical protein [Candidatus Schekmanbacteria bacterium]
MKYKPIPLDGIKTYPLKSRTSKVGVAAFARPVPNGPSFTDFLDCLPKILAGENFAHAVQSIVKAHSSAKPVIWAMGAHVIKCGLSPIIIQLMEKGIISAVALNGAGIIHDFELACIGQTSEDVEVQLQEGRFGMAQETGELLNQAINQGVAEGLGLGAAVGKYLQKTAPPYIEYSLVAAAYRLDLPLTVHVALGTDIIHIHPQANGAAIGQGSHLDFRLLSGVIADLEGGGVFINAGSAVVMPEVFLKAVTLIRNLGQPLNHFTTINLDFMSHYRPMQNIVKRPTGQGGKGYSFIGHHELLIPLLAAAVLKELE